MFLWVDLVLKLFCDCIYYLSFCTWKKKKREDGFSFPLFISFEIFYLFSLRCFDPSFCLLDRHNICRSEISCFYGFHWLLKVCISVGFSYFLVFYRPLFSWFWDEGLSWNCDSFGKFFFGEFGIIIIKSNQIMFGMDDVLLVQLGSLVIKP